MSSLALSFESYWPFSSLSSPQEFSPVLQDLLPQTFSVWHFLPGCFQLASWLTADSDYSFSWSTLRFSIAWWWGHFSCLVEGPQWWLGVGENPAFFSDSRGFDDHHSFSCRIRWLSGWRESYSVAIEQFEDAVAIKALLFLHANLKFDQFAGQFWW